MKTFLDFKTCFFILVRHSENMSDNCIYDEMLFMHPYCRLYNIDPEVYSDFEEFKDDVRSFKIYYN